MEFRVVDKVKVIEARGDYTGKFGIICEVRGPERSYKYAAYFNGNRWDWQPFRPKDIEKIPSYVKGEQLLFSFMDDAT